MLKIMHEKIKMTKGFEFLPLLTLIFITLKLTGHITWPWFYVISPILISFVIFLLILLIGIIFVAIKEIK